MPRTRAKAKVAYHHGDLRSALIRASLKLIEKEGIEGLTLRKVAKLAGVTHAAPYAHFEDKDDLIAAVKEEGFKELRDKLRLVLEQTTSSPWEKLERVGKAYVEFALKQPAKFQVMFRKPLRNHKPKYQFIRPGQEIFEMALKVFLEEMPGGKGREETALVAWGAIHGIVSLWIDGPLVHLVPETATPEGFAKISEGILGEILRLLKGTS